MAELVKMCDLDDLKDGGMFKVEVLGCDYMVIKASDDIYVLDAACTHEWGDLSQGTLEADTVTCPLHGGQFNIKSGEVIREPPSFPLQTYNVKIVENEVFADVTGY
ncbi:MAG: Rieske (2Fe-2S) protein [Thermoplasmata archaeon]